MADKRTRRQQGLIADWKARGCRGTIEAATGFGKTWLGLMAAKEEPPGSSIIVIVPTTDLYVQWEILLAQWGIKAIVRVSKTAVKRVAYAKSVGKPLKADLIIYDEMHNYGTEQGITLITDVMSRKAMGLTATRERSDGRHEMLDQYLPLVGTVPLEECLREGYVAPFRTYNVGITLPLSDRLRYNRITEKFQKLFALFNHDLQTVMACMRDEEAARYWAIHRIEPLTPAQRKSPLLVEVYNRAVDEERDKLRGQAVQVNRLMKERKDFLYGHPEKLRLAIKLLQVMDQPAITFSQVLSVPQQLEEAMPGESLSYGSHRTKPQRKAVLAAFADPNNPVRYIHTSRALDEGKDLPELGLAIILSGSSKDRQMLQRTGRVIRQKEGKRATVINLYIRDTQDERWLRDAQKKTPDVLWIPHDPDVFIQKLTPS